MNGNDSVSLHEFIPDEIRNNSVFDVAVLNGPPYGIIVEWPSLYDCTTPCFAVEFNQG